MLRLAFAFVFCLLAPAVSARSADELCQIVLEKYGVVSAACSLTADVPRELAALPVEQRESNVFFLSGGAALDPRSMAQLEVLAAVLQTSVMSGACLRLEGHSDTSGSAAGNLDISRQRAETVAAFLKARLGEKATEPGSRIAQVDALGESLPLSNIPGEARANRRVTIYARACQ